MKVERFNEILADRLKMTEKVLGEKAGEYSSAADRLHNFKSAARMSNKNESPEEALWGMYRKHLVSVLDMVDKSRDPNYIPDPLLLNAKITDSVNYPILLEALFIERIDNAAGRE